MRRTGLSFLTFHIAADAMKGVPMMAAGEKTGAFDASPLNRQRCPDCSGTAELRIGSAACAP